VLHEEDGNTSSRADLAEITRSHAGAFPEKEIEWLHELVDGNRVAHQVRFVLVHSGRYGDLDPTGKRVQLWEMIFHRFDGDVIAESWRMTYPDSVTPSSQLHSSCGSKRDPAPCPLGKFEFV
jgi:predicted ester cyclase